tara:strand:- start:1126 stop:1386 length:261 start_codon:yes stop_codon:yes gene_type:complete
MIGESFQAMKLERFPTEVGITAETIPAIEKSNQLLFDTLDAHFRHYPYILGGRPSIADAAIVRRQTIWDQSARFLRDTFLPVTSPV